jgi:hypothetical protein
MAGGRACSLLTSSGGQGMVADRVGIGYGGEKERVMNEAVGSYTAI